MSLQITGTVIDILPEQSGTGRNGEWRKQEFILETPGQYPAQVCVVQWGDNIEGFGITQGETITAHIDLRSREYNGRWYTDVKAWKVERTDDESPGDAPPEAASGGSDDGLPF